MAGARLILQRNHSTNLYICTWTMPSLQKYSNQKFFLLLRTIKPFLYSFGTILIWALLQGPAYLSSFFGPLPFYNGLEPCSFSLYFRFSPWQLPLPSLSLEHAFRTPLRFWFTISSPSPPPPAPMTLLPLLSRPRTPRLGSALSVDENQHQELASRLRIRIIGIPAQMQVWNSFGLDKMWRLGRRTKLARGKS